MREPRIIISLYYIESDCCRRTIRVIDLAIPPKSVISYYCKKKKKRFSNLYPIKYRKLLIDPEVLLILILRGVFFIENSDSEISNSRDIATSCIILLLCL